MQLNQTCYIHLCVYVCGLLCVHTCVCAHVTPCTSSQDNLGNDTSEPQRVKTQTRHRSEVTESQYTGHAHLTWLLCAENDTESSLTNVTCLCLPNPSFADNILSWIINYAKWQVHIIYHSNGTIMNITSDGYRTLFIFILMSSAVPRFN